MHTLGGSHPTGVSPQAGGQAAHLGHRVSRSPLCVGCSQSAREGERHFVHGETEAGAAGRVLGMVGRGTRGGREDEAGRQGQSKAEPF